MKDIENEKITCLDNKKIMHALHLATRSKRDEEAEKSESPQLKGIFAMNTTYAPPSLFTLHPLFE